jgi:Predicted membrane protein
VLLYLNLIYFPCWVSVVVMVSSLKYHLLSYLYKFVLLTVLTAFILIEVVRLYLGYLGRTREM